MTLVLAVGGIAVLALTLLWRARTRRGRTRWYDALHTPPTVPWTDGKPQGKAPRGTDAAAATRSDGV